MKKNKLIVGIFLLIFALSNSIVLAQEFNIPEPTCVETPEIPCPGKGHSYEQAQKPTNKINYEVSGGFSKIFEYLKNISTEIGDTTRKTFEELKEWFGNVYENIYQSLLRLKF